jgi:hypothetical protein
MSEAGQSRDAPREHGAWSSSEGARVQIRGLASESLAAARETHPLGTLVVTLVGGDRQLARALEADDDVSVSHVDGGARLGCSGSNHVVIVLLPPVPAPDRVELVRAAHRSVRPAGVLVVIATVVVAPGESRDLVPSMRQLLEELNDASGLELHVDELRSVRWHGETFFRGVTLSATSLSVQDEP